jgi:hypothetical protein
VPSEAKHGPGWGGEVTDRAIGCRDSRQLHPTPSHHISLRSCEPTLPLQEAEEGVILKRY